MCHHQLAPVLASWWAPATHRSGAALGSAHHPHHCLHTACSAHRVSGKLLSVTVHTKPVGTLLALVHECAEGLPACFRSHHKQRGCGQVSTRDQQPLGISGPHTGSSPHQVPLVSLSAETPNRHNLSSCCWATVTEVSVGLPGRALSSDSLHICSRLLKLAAHE